MKSQIKFLKPTSSLKTKKGFTLIEMSIVILIIGLLIASVTGGKKLISLSNISKARALTNSAPMLNMEDLALWFETTSKNSFSSASPTDNSAISVWNDINIQRIIGARNNAVQATGANQPLYIASAISGLPAVRFDGVNDFLQIASLDSSSLYLSNQVTIFIVFKTLSITGAASQVFFSYQNGPNNRIGTEVFSSITPGFDFVNDTTGRVISSYTLQPNKPIILSEVANSSTQSMYINGASVGSRSNSLSITPFVGTIYIGQFTFGNLQANADIGEIIVFSRGLSDFERGEVEKYLSKKWGIQLT